jgi:nitrate/nitrite transport system substrate-binding protein
MKRWGYDKGDVDYQKVDSQVLLADQCREVMKSLCYKTN